MIECIKGFCIACAMTAPVALCVAALAQLEGRHTDALSLLIVGATLCVVAIVGFTISARAEARQ